MSEQINAAVKAERTKHCANHSDGLLAAPPLGL
jgi:hypothetical protein